MAEILPLADAVSALIQDGDTVAMEGFTHLIPHAAGHAVIRAGLRDLTAVRMTPDLIYDQVIGMGCVGRLVFSWGGNPGVGSLHRFRDAVEKGWPRPLEIEERSHADLANAYVAGASGLPFSVIRGYAGSDLPAHNPIIRFIECPFTGEKLAASPAVRPDVAVLHAQQADRKGNVMLWGISGVQKEVALASRRVLVTVEEIVDALEPRPGSVHLPHWVVSVVSPAPGGARPLVRARLLPARQRFLRGVGRHFPRPGAVHGLDGAPRAGHRGFRRLRAERRRRSGCRGSRTGVDRGRARRARPRRGAGVVERGGLENRCTRERTVGSNPTPSAIR